MHVHACVENSRNGHGRLHCNGRSQGKRNAALALCFAQTCDCNVSRKGLSGFAIFMETAQVIIFLAENTLPRRIRAFFSALPRVVSPFRAFGIAAASHPPRCARRHLLRPHRSPYCLCARSLGNFTEKCPSCRATRFFLRCTCATPTSRRTCAFVGSGGCKQSSNIGVCAFGTTG